MRQASTEMSWVADEKATTSANTTTAPMSADGSSPDMAKSPAPTPTWATSIQERRCPKRRVSPGRATRSTTGAQRTFTE